jgi:hypothetical protein
MTAARPLARFGAMGERFASGLAPSSYTTPWDTIRDGAWMTLPRRVALWRALCYES